MLEITEPVLDQLAQDLAHAAKLVDATRPVARNKRSGEPFGPGLGPHSEGETFALLIDELNSISGERYTAFQTSVPYPSGERQRCDFCFRIGATQVFAEGKLLRLKGDNGKPNDNMLMHLLSPYKQHRSALTDCVKLKQSCFPGRKIIVIVAYEYSDMPLELAVTAFETLAGPMIGRRHEALFEGLCHPVHTNGKMLVWSVH